LFISCKTRAIPTETSVVDIDPRAANSNPFPLVRRQLVQSLNFRIVRDSGVIRIASVQAYAKINWAGEWIERTENVRLNDLFDPMCTQEWETNAQPGVLTEWSSTTVGAKK
jgi:hypothetical protein